VLGKARFGRHDTRDSATGMRADRAPEAYEFGDTMNRICPATLAKAFQREGLTLP